MIYMGHTPARNEVVVPYVSPCSSGLNWRVRNGRLYQSVLIFYENFARDQVPQLRFDSSLYACSHRHRYD